MSGRVYRLHSTLELPLEEVEEYLNGDPDLPPEVTDVEVTRRNNTLILKAVAAEDNLSKYTPTAQLKASITENRVYEEEPPRAGAPRWEEEEEEIPSELVEFACFKGDRETVLQNTAVQYGMFEVLKEIAKLSEKGTLTAISEHDGELEATRIVEGEQRPATVEVVENPQNSAGKNGVDWRDNEFIDE